MAGFKYFMMLDVTEIAVCVRGRGSGFMLVSNGLHTEPIARIPITQSSVFTYYGTKISMENGKQALYFTYVGSGRLDFKSLVLK
ncbi:Xylosidase/arabinosidase [compost metagenome]